MLWIVLFYLSFFFISRLNIKYANTVDTTALKGIKILVPNPNNSSKIIVKAKGSGTNLKSLIKYLYASAPNKAVNAVSKAGFNASLFKKGVNGTNNATPKPIINVVTIVLVATEIVEIISPSLLPCLTPAISLAFTAHGTFRFTKLPVKKAKYVPLTPRSGEYVITSIKPPIMKTIRGIKL